MKVSTQLVIQAVTVTDKDGKTLSGLTAEDFTLTEDNNPQTISVFEFQKIDDTSVPQPLPSSTQQFAGVLQPAITRITPVPEGDTRYQDRRLLALYFDMSTLNAIDRFRALTAAQTFIEKEMKGPDLVALFTYADGSVHVRRDFTDDRSALDESLQRLLYPKDTDALEDTVADFGQNAGEFNLFNTDRQLSALQTAVNMLGVLKEKKSLIYFASGLNLNGVDNQAQLRATLNAARRANVAFFPVSSSACHGSAWPRSRAPRTSSCGWLPSSFSTCRLPQWSSISTGRIRSKADSISGRNWDSVS